MTILTIRSHKALAMMAALSAGVELPSVPMYSPKRKQQSPEEAERRRKAAEEKRARKAEKIRKQREKQCQSPTNTPESLTPTSS